MKQFPVKCNGWFLPSKYTMNVYGTLYRRKSKCGDIYIKMINHEGIHECQTEDFISNSKEKKWIKNINYTIFYILYGIEWFIKMFISLFTLLKIKAYKSISFEQEAYNNDDNFQYQETRKKYSWVKYIFKLIWKD